MRLELSNNDKYALIGALDNYLNGLGMEHEDEDEAALESILATLNGA